MAPIPRSVPGKKPMAPSTPPSSPSSKYSPPRKEKIQGSYKYIQYRPAWTDPDWQDEGLERQKVQTGPKKGKNVWEIHDPIFDRLRPALLPRDAFSNPTIYAQRFSIFPGRTDGRSRTSPTRADSRKLFPANTGIKTGKQLFDRFEELAKDDGQHEDDFMEDARLDLKNLSETEQQYMQQYEDLIIDEHWQNILFGSLTMDEILAEGYLTMCDTNLNELSGPLFELFARDRWVDCRNLGHSEAKPRFMYTLDGQREEWDPRVRRFKTQMCEVLINCDKNNDRVWNAMQSALQLATRLLLLSEDFVEGLQDITNRFWVEDKLFTVLSGQDRAKKLKFMRDPNTMGPRKVNGAQAVKDSGLDVLELSSEVLRQLLEIKLSSGFDMGNKPSRNLVLGVEYAPPFFSKRTKITVDIDAELVWPLLVDKYTKSEKLMANVILASTLAHEMMHAFCSAPFKWLGDPASFGVTDPGQLAACKVLNKELIDPHHKDRWDEPHFEDDIYAEVGHAFEEHVLSCGYWPFIFGTTNKSRPLLLQTAGGLISSVVHSEGLLNAVPNLKEPIVQFTILNHLVRFGDVKKYFSQSFWDVAIDKYGSAALREPSRKPHKFNFYPADQDYDGLIVEQLNISEEDAEWLRKLRRRMILNRQYVLWNYLHNIMTETAQYDSTTARLDHAVMRWIDEGPWIKMGREIHMVVCEFLTYYAQTYLPQVEAGSLESLYNAWDNTRQALGSTPDWQSEQLYQNSAPFNDSQECWQQKLQSGNIEHFELRLIPRLIDFTDAIGRELGHHETLLCELYQGGSQFWNLWLQNEPDHIRRWRTHVKEMQDIFDDIGTAMQLVQEGMKGLEGEDWGQRIWILGRRIEDLVKLLSFDPAQYDWRDLMWTLPMIRKSRRLPHQRYYFLAKKEMMKMTGNDLASLKNFKIRFQGTLSLGTYKMPLPGTADPDALSIAQRLPGTLDDDRGNSPRAQQIKGPSTGIFSVKQNLASRLNQEEKEAQEAKINRSTETRQRNTGFQTLQGEAAAQAYRLPSIQPKFQQMGMDTQPNPLSRFKTFNGSNGPFAAYSSGTGAFPTHQPNQPPAWEANSAFDMAAWANKPLNNASAAAHGIMPHPYAIRATVTEDLRNTAAFSLPTRDPSTFVNQYPREPAVPIDTPLRAGVLGDIDQRWNEDSDSDVSMSDVSVGGHAGRASAVSEFDYNSSATETSEDEESLTSKSSDTSLSLSSEDEGDRASAGSDEFPTSKKGQKRPNLKRKPSRAAVHMKMKRVGVSVTKRRSPKFELKKGADYRKRKGESLGWRKILSGLSGA
ncbi:hypothetical protein FLAG1_08528 [Fusarium langsethiae]|uniref:Uncharacterized protein n=1 Tax=Fusarium langsethiae TaxID=179993 RepID=A0A0N0DCR8_FUSLA|nr:hypothetical protein FLAG1_08528 [Fusarium langsethiae]GKU02790.1 unnamed protein product [Fusarium langsethiae]